MKPVLIINIFQGGGRFRAIAGGNEFIAMQADGDTLVNVVENVMTEMKMANPQINKKLRPPRLRKPDITRDLDGIDEEIRPLMVAINKLPFVKHTVMSCAGYGKNAFPEHPHGTRKDGLWHGWFSVVYKDGTKHRNFDKGLRKIADCRENHDRGVVVYDFASENVHGLMAKWLCIGELVKTHLKGK